MPYPINTAVILAAGMGTRLGAITEKMPKGFVKINGESLIERSILLLQQKGICNIVVGCGHESEHYQNIKDKYGLKLYHNHEYDSTGSLYTMILANDIVGDNFLLLESDILYDGRALDELIEASAEDLVLLSGTTHSGDEVYAECDDNLGLVQLSKSKEDLNEIKGELVGISKISKSTLSSLYLFVNDEKSRRKLDYEKGLVAVAKEQGVKVKLVEDLIWCEVDNEAHLERAKTKIYPLLK